MGLFDKKHSVGKTIATLRKEKGWTQVELAEKLQVSDKAVSKWEKDDAFPSIEFFPVLSELFGVSIDYLMTGQNAEPQIVTMSKSEFCAKNNIPAMVKEIDCMYRDENGKTLIDYIVEYECLDVFVELCSINRKNISKFKILDAVKFCILSNRLDLLTKVTFQINSNVRYEFNTAKDIMGLLPEGALEHFGNNQGMDRYVCILPDFFFQMILSDKRIKSETIDFILGKQANRQSVWYHAFPYLIHQCYEDNNKEMLSRLLMLTKENNDYAYSNLTSNQNYAYSYFFIGFYNSKNGHGLVRILEKTTKLALDRGDFDLVSDFNAINSAVINYQNSFKCYVASSDEIRIARLKFDKSVSAEDVAIQSAIHNGVLCIDEILATNNYKLIKKAIETYPVTLFEIQGAVIESAIKHLSDNNWRDLFKYSVDNCDKKLITFVLERDAVSCGKILNYYLEHIGNITYPEDTKSNSNHMKLRKRASFGSDYKGKLAFIDACKKQILDDCALKLDMDRVTDDLDEVYFKAELEKGNFEIIIIKLCVRLEAILRGKYHYEGDFSEMLNQYCSKHGREDDGWGYDIEANFVKYLHKLRKCRNNIVHSERTEEAMTIDEIRFCIEYICRMG